MRHNVSGRKLNRTAAHRKMLYRNLVTALFQSERIQTTVIKAKEARSVAERLITFAKRGDLHARRLATEVIRDRKTVAKLFERIAPRYADRPGGYTRIIKLGHRLGDNAALSLIALVEEAVTPKAKQKAPKAAPVKKAAPAPVAAPVVEEPVAEMPAATVVESAVAEVPAEGEQKDA